MKKPELLAPAFFAALALVVFFCPPPAAAKDTAVWWGCDFVELSLSGTTVVIDPYGELSRKANLILSTHSHSDHCHPASIQKIIGVSDGATDLIIGSKDSGGCFGELPGIEKRMADRWENISYRNLKIETVPSYEDRSDIGYFIQDPKTKISVLHLGDNHAYTDDFKKLAGIDYLFLAMGKMSHGDMVLLLKDLRPKYLVPIHYRLAEGNVLGKEYDYPSPGDPESYLKELERQMEAAGLETKVMRVKPGETLKLVR